MEFTGERYVPSHLGITRTEHLHRYAVAASFVAGKQVVDIACGEGYGVGIYAQSAASVVGVDIDAACIEHARKSYVNLANARFEQGAADAIPLPDASVDVVTSFETLEHHDRHDGMMREVKRVLKPDGMLVISTPNRPVYSRNGSYCNPYHVKELDQRAFEELLCRYFPSVMLYGQTLSTVSAIAPVQAAIGNLRAFSANNQGGFSPDVRAASVPKYFFAVCSDTHREQAECHASVYFDDANNDLEGALEEVNHRLTSAQDQIRFMQSSIFWRLREGWWHTRRFLPWLLASLAAVTAGMWVGRKRR